jgi:hypothetical protein
VLRRRYLIIGLTLLCATLAAITCVLLFRVNYQQEWIKFLSGQTVDKTEPVFLEVRAEGASKKDSWQHIRIDASSDRRSIVAHGEVTRRDSSLVEAGNFYAYIFSLDAAKRQMRFPTDGNVFQAPICNGRASITFPISNELPPGEYKLKVGYDGGKMYSDPHTTIFFTID